jgi:hypothetical protein
MPRNFQLAWRLEAFERGTLIFEREGTNVSTAIILSLLAECSDQGGLLYILRRVALGLVILLIVALLLFGMMHMIPGDPTVVALGPRSTPEMREAFRQLMGLDRADHRTARRVSRPSCQGNLGLDVWSRRPVVTMILEVLPYTVTLAWRVSSGPWRSASCSAAPPSCITAAGRIG